MESETLAFLRRLLDTPSPSGHESDGQRIWIDHVRPAADRVWNDAYGNCFARLEGSRGDAPTIAICGHADEIGLMVNTIDDKGFVSPAVLHEIFAEIDALPTVEEREIRAQAFQHYRRVMTLPFQSDEERCKMDGNGMVSSRRHDKLPTASRTWLKVGKRTIF